MNVCCFLNPMACLLLFFGSIPHAEAKEDSVIAAAEAVRMLQDESMTPDGGHMWIKVLSDNEIDQQYDKGTAKKLRSGKSKIQEVINLCTSGLHPGDRYTLYLVNALMEKNKSADLIVNSEGELITVKEKALLSNMQIMLSGMAVGEPIYYVLASSNKKKHLAVGITVRPVEFTWPDTAYIKLNGMSQNYTRFLVVGKNFKPNEELIITSQSGQENIPINEKVNKDGTFRFLISPATIGSSGGSARLSIQRKDSNKIIPLDYSWGLAAHPK